MRPSLWTAEEFARECEAFATTIRRRAASREIQPNARFHLFEWYRVLKDELATDRGLARLAGADPALLRVRKNDQCVARVAGVRKCVGGAT